ncbi:hypothetical protein [Microvirga zambiensis]|uniref:hypothetical protein n=1 Tax=Microvirga zambiensis TaxID=1402137 RepID=UPI00191E8388|nr:hypothetical protein [Microvirga zambiensis]
MTASTDMNSLVWALNTRLIAGATATGTLLAWCEEHGLSDGPITVDVRQRFAPALVPDDILPALELNPGETIDYRQVQLMRGALPLATAENWFVPQRLTAAMNKALNTTETPFATVIAPLRPVRRILAAAIQPQSGIILEQVALVRSGSGAALALVKEGYLPDLVSFDQAPALWQRARDPRAERSAMQSVRFTR